MDVNANATGVICLVINGDDDEEEVEEGTDADDDDCKQFLHPHIFHHSGC